MRQENQNFQMLQTSLLDHHQQAQSEISNIGMQNSSTGSIQSATSFHNIPKSFKGSPDESVGLFVGHSDLYLDYVLHQQRLNLSIS